MYSYEDRIRVVQLYIKLGKCIRATIRQLGYPTKNALKNWHREYERRSALPVSYAGRPPKYSQKRSRPLSRTTLRMIGALLQR
jgi:transposase-like protein